MEDQKRPPVPDEKKVLGIIEELLGYAHARVKCFDGKIRICRVPKKLSRKIWLRKGEYVLVEPWEIQGDKKGDIVYAYTLNEIEWLKKKGYFIIEKEEF